MVRPAPEIDFTPWIVCKNGFWAGVRDDAPEEIKKAYEEYMEERNRMEEEGFF